MRFYNFLNEGRVGFYHLPIDQIISKLKEKGELVSSHIPKLRVQMSLAKKANDHEKYEKIKKIIELINGKKFSIEKVLIEPIIEIPELFQNLGINPEDYMYKNPRIIASIFKKKYGLRARTILEKLLKYTKEINKPIAYERVDSALYVYLDFDDYDTKEDEKEKLEEEFTKKYNMNVRFDDDFHDFYITWLEEYLHGFFKLCTKETLNKINNINAQFVPSTTDSEHLAECENNHIKNSPFKSYQKVKLFIQNMNLSNTLENYKQGWHSSENEFYTIVHELGHAFYHYDMAQNNLEIPHAEDDYNFYPEVAGQVSKYATKNSQEFIAETFAGLSFKKIFSPEVMQLYEAFHGPKPIKLNVKQTIKIENAIKREKKYNGNN